MRAAAAGLLAARLLALSLCGGAALADSPAAAALRQWLEVFDSGDRARIESFDATHVQWLTPARAMELRARTGGYQLLSIEQSGELWIMFRAREKATAQEILGRLFVSPDDPGRITHLSFDELPLGARVQETVAAAERARVLESAARVLDQSYVFADAAKKMAAALLRARRHDTYGTITDAQIFAWQVSADLWAIAHDGHLSVRYSAGVVPPGEPPRPADDPGERARLLAANCGFEKAEHLPPNIGYLRFDEFAPPEICGPTAAAAMTFVADSDVLILDLRDNHGGMGAMVTLIASYLFDAPTHLNDAYTREDNSTRQFWTAAYVPGRKFLGKPLYVLTSRATFSAAEDLSYALKNLKRATLIGETTGGGAHPIASRRLDDHFLIVVPIARSISPITRTDWEGTGVEPDVKVPADEALAEALRRARKD